MYFRDFTELRDHQRKNKGNLTAAVACANDTVTLAAVRQCMDEGICGAILVGDREKIEASLAQLGAKAADFEILHEADPAEAARKTVECVKNGRAQFIAKGSVDTSVLLRAVVAHDSGLRTGRMMSHIAFLKIPNYHKLIALTDSGMVLRPDLAQKKEIAENAVAILSAMGYDHVKIGALASVEKVNPKMQATLDAQALAEMSRDGTISGCTIEGPVSYDILMDKRSAEKKGYTGHITGDADVMLVPDMDAGNILGKALVCSAGAQMAGIIVGAKVPIALTSRGAHVEEKYQSILLAASCV